ncbi:MAG TPA: crossover junction endodeoxyribonuclease RuvC [Candidatus Saccharimonadaceae bacterium]|nr:crossover junction endodeoxyribonuclease RuvC [Candidatus Saccharimonadaceae bacterium]
MRVLGLDPGSRRTGYGVVEGRGNQWRCLTRGVIVPPARATLPERLYAIASRAGTLIEEFAPDCVAVEEAFYHENVRSTLVLGHVRGALLVAAVERRVAVSEYTPREIKMSVTGNGGAAKEQVAYMVRRLLSLDGVLEVDASDALATALCHLHRARRPAALGAARAGADGLAALLARRVVARKVVRP